MNVFQMMPSDTGASAVSCGSLLSAPNYFARSAFFKSRSSESRNHTVFQEISCYVLASRCLVFCVFGVWRSAAMRSFRTVGSCARVQMSPVVPGRGAMHPESMGFHQVTIGAESNWVQDVTDSTSCASHRNLRCVTLAKNGPGSPKTLSWRHG